MFVVKGGAKRTSSTTLYIERVFVTESYACEAGVLGEGVNFNSNFFGARNFVDGLRDICESCRISIVCYTYIYAYV